MKRIAISAALIGFTAGAVYAANKTATLVPPAALTDVNSIRIEPSDCPSKTAGVCAAPAAKVTVDACARDAATGVKDCAVATFTVPYANAQLQNIVSAALTAWKNAKTAGGNY